jgi:hypothetical protein
MIGDRDLMCQLFNSICNKPASSIKLCKLLVFCDVRYSDAEILGLISQPANTVY